jgi:membrane protein DedA with SNARE-associated domain
MRYPKFLAFNAAGGLVWGIGFTLLGYLAGNSYQTIETTVGRGAAIAVAAIVVLAIIVWRVRKHRADSHAHQRN